MSAVTNQPIQLSYFVADIATALLTYDRLRWHRSRAGKYGTYEPATAAAAAPAVLDGANLTPHQISGKSLRLRVDGAYAVDVVFASPDPVTTAQAVAEINAATALLVASDNAGKLRLTSALTGSGAGIEILDGDANLSLGFTEGDDAVGKDADTALVSGTHEYLYTDQNSSADFWYRAELVNSTTAASTGLGVPFPAGNAQSVSKAATIVCYLRLADMTGIALEGRRVTFHNSFLPNTVVDQVHWGLFRHYAQVSTDRNGYAEIRLVRGMVVDMSIDGTGFVRRLQIPTTGDSVDLLDSALVVEDEFGIARPDIDFAIRTS